MFIHLQVSPSYSGGGGGGGTGGTYYYTINSNANGIELWDDIIAENGGIPTEDNIYVTINSGVDIGAINNSSATNYALNVSGDFASNSKTLTIENNGYISGFGGDGGQYETPPSLIYADGQDGGVGISFSSNATLINTSTGVIAGGGGGGAGGNGSTVEPSFTFYGDGAGGAGLPPGEPGYGDYNPLDSTQIGANDNATKTAGGTSEVGVSPDAPRGGDGGNPGQPGGTNSDASGGSAGYAYQTVGVTVNVTNNGSIFGPIGTF